FSAFDQSTHRSRRVEREDQLERLPFIRILIVRILIVHVRARMSEIVHVRARTGKSEYNQQNPAKHQSIPKECLHNQTSEERLHNQTSYKIGNGMAGWPRHHFADGITHALNDERRMACHKKSAPSDFSKARRLLGWCVAASGSGV